MPTLMMRPLGAASVGFIANMLVGQEVGDREQAALLLFPVASQMEQSGIAVERSTVA